mmetsp:Transcript_22604/g.32370  ORF Transcript_22604/g.32370 Transcript_22604/m.32370 type:complete len:148 (+) Transcript_22604:206-649(+)|eukprot:CAMPEP_0172420102 /NCGR_PEP_ID=MMETSP1064-20121228/6511_1 /TAXON_ID=202472 /ORGANISM="Aulacoseira subarctica , Strain CCAP 1002/5" /LENGTH=147 /DNA_ID=CAMNT_0013159913 /DNA_START=205 /DNA_END=648 /DNA_ORIENTATION=+
MSGGNKSIFLQQLEQLAEVTSVSPRKVWKRPHVRFDSEFVGLQTPPKNHLLPSFTTCDKLSKSNEVEPSPDQFPFPKANLLQPFEKILSHPARKRSPSPLSMEDIITKVTKIEKSPGDNFRGISKQQSDISNDAEDSSDSDSGFYTQ